MATTDQLADASAKAAYASAGGAMIAGLSLNEWAAIIAIIVAVATFLANCWFQRQRLRLSTRKLEAEIEALHNAKTITLSDDHGD